jgi:hypothetical protein
VPAFLRLGILPGRTDTSLRPVGGYFAFSIERASGTVQSSRFATDLLQVHSSRTDALHVTISKKQIRTNGLGGRLEAYKRADAHAARVMRAV